MNVENNREDWLLWQISDSALPTGGFVASSGLESAIQTGYVHDIPSLSIFLSSSIDNYAFSSLPFVTAQGVAMLILFSKSFNDKIVEDFKLNVRKELACGHLPVCFGLVTRYLGISLGDYLYHFIW
ncbi:11547_t:CDS:2 [Entrophospora sp. SA101]|nr:11547_t:CDS:2 [Entrophospora sp. SA101]